MRRRVLICCVLIFPAVFAHGQTGEKGPPDPKRWESAIAKFEKEDEQNPFSKGGIVFTGSSSIALWKDLGKYFPEHKVLNRGFGGSTLPDVNHYLPRTVLKHEPKTVVLFCGGNDLASKRTPQQVLGEFQRFHRTIHEKLPDTRVLYLSIHLPPGRINQAEQISTANALIAKECQGDRRLTFVNIHEIMLGKDGQPNLELYRDKLHPNEKAYQMWAEKLRPVLK